MAALGIPAGWQLANALASHPSISVVPHCGEDVRLVGELQVDHAGPSGVHITATYKIKIHVPPKFPCDLPSVYEIGEAIPRDFHQLSDGSLCLGSLAGIRVQFGSPQTIGRFIDRVVIPYLYSHAYMKQFGSMPFGELAHGVAGLEDDVRQLIGLPRNLPVGELLRLAAVHRRHANKRPCPCSSGRRLGRCHHAHANAARALLGRAVCMEQAIQLEKQRQPKSTARQNARIENGPSAQDQNGPGRAS